MNNLTSTTARHSGGFGRSRIHIALQRSGRLSDLCRDLLRDAGLQIEAGENSLTARADNFPVEIVFVRDDDIPTFVSAGTCELGIVGQNVLEEFALGSNARGFDEVAELGFGQCSLRIAAPDRLSYQGPKSLMGQRIATSYPRLLQRFLNDQDVEAVVVPMKGTVELAPRFEISNYICDLVSTGATLDANGLRPVETILKSEAALICTRNPLDVERLAIASQLFSQIDGVLRARDPNPERLGKAGTQFTQALLR